MSNFKVNVHVKNANVLKGYNNSYLWKHQLKEYAKNKFNNPSFLPVSAFSLNLLEDCTEIIKENVMFEFRVDDYDKITEGVEVRWFAKITEICGYRVFARWIGGDSEKDDICVNILSDEVHCVGDAGIQDSDMNKIVYAPPLHMSEKHADDLDIFLKEIVDVEMTGCTALSKSYEEGKKNLFSSRFSIGERIELLNYNDSRKLRVARIQNICGRRLNVLVTKHDYGGEWTEKEDDRQLHNRGAEYWIDQESFFVFPVGWASYNGYGLDAKSDYIAHGEQIAKSLKKGETPSYNSIDVTPSHFNRPTIPEEHLKKLKVGQKLELIDPLAQQFHDLKVASVLRILNSDGYVVIGIDGPDAEEDCVPLYITSPFIFPVGYAKQNGLKLCVPPGYDEESFNWANYMRETKSEPMPIEFFKPEPSPERLSLLKVGAKLEAADLCENQLVCPASIKEVKGRIINVNFDGWDTEFDELYDIDSHDIFPVGWCEVHGYILQEPKKDE